MKCPSCQCENYSKVIECSSCGFSSTGKSKSLLKRIFSKYIVGLDRNGCQVALEPRSKGSVLVSDGIKSWWADGTEDYPIQLQNLAQLTDALNLMGVTCDGIIGQLVSDSDSPLYLQIGKDGITTTSDKRSDVIYDPSKIESTLVGKIASWQCDGKIFRLSRLKGPDEGKQCCQDRYFLTFDCEGDYEYTKAIKSLSDLIIGCTNTGALLLYDGVNGHGMNLSELTSCDRTRWSVVFQEEETPIDLDCGPGDCSDIKQITRTWYKTKDIILLDSQLDVITDQLTNPLTGSQADQWVLAAFLRSGKGTIIDPACMKLVKLTLKENELITADEHGNLIKKKFDDLVGKSKGSIEVGRIQFMDSPVVLATSSTGVDLTAILTVPFCSGSLFGFFVGEVTSPNNSIGSVTVNGFKIAQAGTSTSPPTYGRGGNWIKISDPENISIVITGGPPSSVTLSAIACQ